MSNRKYLLHLRNNALTDEGKAIAPKAESVEYGEIAMNYASGQETLYIKNDEDEIVPLRFEPIISENYQPITYNSGFTANTVESGETHEVAINIVEDSVSKLVDEVIKNEKVTSEAVHALGGAAGIIDEDSIIAYIQNSGATYISKATSLAEADDMLDRAISNLNLSISEDYDEIEYDEAFDGNPVAIGDSHETAINKIEWSLNELVNKTLDDEVVTDKGLRTISKASGILQDDNSIGYVANLDATYISGATNLAEADDLLDAAITNLTFTISEDYQLTTYDETFSGVPVSIGDEYETAINKVEYSLNELVDGVIKDEKITSEAIHALGGAAGTINDESVIAYIQNSGATYISKATSLAEADDMLDRAISNLNLSISEDYRLTEYDEAFNGEPVSVGDSHEVAINKVEWSLNTLVNETLDNEETVSKAIRALGVAAGTIDNDDVIYYTPSRGAYISGATSLAEADDMLNNELYAFETEVISKLDVLTSAYTFINQSAGFDENAQYVPQASLISGFTKMSSAVDYLADAISNLPNTNWTTISMAASTIIIPTAAHLVEINLTGGTSATFVLSTMLKRAYGIEVVMNNSSTSDISITMPTVGDCPVKLINCSPTFVLSANESKYFRIMSTLQYTYIIGV